MKSNMMTIIKKEFARFFTDRRMVVNTLLLPGLIIYVLYSFMGQGIMKMTSVDEEKVTIVIENLPSSLEGALNQLPVKIKIAKETEKEKSLVQEQENQLFVSFPQDFDEQVAAYDVTTNKESAPNVEVYYNSASMKSNHAYDMFCKLLDDYEKSMANKFDINNQETPYDLATNEDSTGMMFSKMLPMLMLIFLFSGCMGIVPEAIAGEKERGTIATLLVTPMKRSQLALGKIISLGVISLLSGLSSFIGIILSMPKMMGNRGDQVNAAVYKVEDYIMLLVIILVTVLVISAAISIISAFSKSVKEASTAVMPLMIVVMLIGVTSMMSDGATKDTALYFIPLYNSVQCLMGVFSFEYEMFHVVITIVVNLLATGILTFVLTKLFNSEKVMFSK